MVSDKARVVWIVFDGGFGSSSDDDQLCEVIESSLCDSSEADSLISIEKIRGSHALFEKLKTVTSEPQSIIFTSSYMLGDAEKVKTMYFDICILVVAGTMPRDRVAIMPRSLVMAKSLKKLYYHREGLRHDELFFA